jgi:hypothetical protein
MLSGIFRARLKRNRKNVTGSIVLCSHSIFLIKKTSLTHFDNESSRPERLLSITSVTTSEAHRLGRLSSSGQLSWSFCHAHQANCSPPSKPIRKTLWYCDSVNEEERFNWRRIGVWWLIHSNVRTDRSVIIVHFLNENLGQIIHEVLLKPACSLRFQSRNRGTAFDRVIFWKISAIRAAISPGVAIIANQNGF